MAGLGAGSFLGGIYGQILTKSRIWGILRGDSGQKQTAGRLRAPIECYGLTRDGAALNLGE